MKSYVKNEKPIRHTVAAILIPALKLHPCVIECFMFSIALIVIEKKTCCV